MAAKGAKPMPVNGVVYSTNDLMPAYNQTSAPATTTASTAVPASIAGLLYFLVNTFARSNCFSLASCVAISAAWRWKYTSPSCRVCCARACGLRVVVSTLLREMGCHHQDDRVVSLEGG